MVFQMALVQIFRSCGTLRHYCLGGLMKSDFKWKHFEGEVILLAVRWYLRYALTYRDLVELMAERGLDVAHTTVMRWVHQYGALLDKRIRRHLKATCDSWRLDETYIKVKGQWKYLYRAVDKHGDTVEFYFSAHRDQLAAARFFKKALNSSHNSTPRVINVDQNPAYLAAFESAQSAGYFLQTKLRQVKYLNNRIECDHRPIKRLVSHGFGFRTFRTAQQTIRGYEAMRMVKKGQIKNLGRRPLAQIHFINSLFQIAA